MNSAAALFGEIFRITRGDLENACFPYVPAVNYINGLEPLRLTRIAEFWKNDHFDDPCALYHATEELVGGLFGQACPWAFLLRGVSSEIQCWIATKRENVDRPALEALLRSTFPDARYGADLFDTRSIEALRCSLAVTGTPSVQAGLSQERSREQLEKLCRGLFGTNWLYLVAASPLETPEITGVINDLAEKIKDVRANYLLKASPIDEENRTAQRYVDLLETKLKRFERGRVSGMWDTQCRFFTDQPALLARAHQILQAAFSGEDSVPDPIRVRPCSAQVHDESQSEPLTTIELATLTRVPREDSPGFEVIEYARFGVEPSRSASSDAVRIGQILDRGASTGNWLTVCRDDLTKHGLIAGITGSGKTNSCFWLLDQVWDGGKGVPFLVIESAKSEYRALCDNPRFRDMRVFTVGDDTVSPLRLNPFQVPEGILVQTHIDYLKSLFSAAFVLYPPMPYVLEHSIQEVYEDRGWDVARNINSRGASFNRSYPTLSDLAAKIPLVVDRMGYDQRIAMDVKAGLLARINQLRLGGGKGLMLASRRSVSDAILFESPCVLELKQIISDDEKAFLIGLILIRLNEYHEARRRQTGKLVHLTLIEEAHRLLRNVSTEQGSEISANPKGRAIEVFSNILSEIRAFGEGILVAEQIPVKLTPDVVKNTGLKLIHRLVSPDDRELLGSAVNLTEPQIRCLAHSGPGEAVAWTEHTRKAVLVGIPLVPGKDNPPLPDDTLRFAAELAKPAEANLYLPYDGCRQCSGSPGLGCLAVTREPPQQLLVNAFRKLFNALRLNHSAVQIAFAEFRQIVRRGTRSAAPLYPYCVFVALAESETERRGEFRGWPYGDVERVLAMACSMAQMLERRAIKEEEPGIPAELIDNFQSLFRQLEAVESLPFPGCRMCTLPCTYRFDMSQTADQFGREFRTLVIDPKIENRRLLEVANYAAATCFPLEAEGALTGGAFCFIVQQLAASQLNLAPHYQDRMAALLKDEMERRESSV